MTVVALRALLCLGAATFSLAASGALQSSPAIPSAASAPAGKPDLRQEARAALAHLQKVVHAKNAAEFPAAAAAAAPVSQTEYEKYLFSSLRFEHARNFSDEAAMIDAIQAILDSGHLRADETGNYYEGLGSLLRQAKRFPEAGAAYKKATEVAPENGRPISELAQLRVIEERYPEALELFRSAISVEKKAGKIPPSIWYMLAAALADKLNNSGSESLLREGKVVEGAHLGVALSSVSLAQLRAAAQEIREDSGRVVAGMLVPPAETPLRVGDIVLTVDGEPLTRLKRVDSALASKSAGQQVALEIWRDGSRRKLVATKKGLTVAELSERTSRYAALQVEHRANVERLAAKERARAEKKAAGGGGGFLRVMQGAVAGVYGTAAGGGTGLESAIAGAVIGAVGGAAGADTGTVYNSMAQSTAEEKARQAAMERQGREAIAEGVRQGEAFQAEREAAQRAQQEHQQQATGSQSVRQGGTSSASSSSGSSSGGASLIVSVDENARRLEAERARQSALAAQRDRELVAAQKAQEAANKAKMEAAHQEHLRLSRELREKTAADKAACKASGYRTRCGSSASKQ